MEKRGFLSKMEKYLSGGSFPIFVMSLIFFTSMFFLLLLLLPAQKGLLGQFAQDFRVWCGGYNPDTGGWDWGYMVMLFSGPLVFLVVFWVVWRHPIKEILSTSPKTVVSRIGLAFCLVGVSSSMLVFFFRPPVQKKQKTYVFPAKALRTAFLPPPFTLTNQEGKKVSLANLKGRVVMITAVYATCGST